MVFRTILCGWARVLSGLETSTQETPVNAYRFRKDMDVFLILQFMPQVFPGALVSSGFHPLMLISGNNCLYCLSDSLLCLNFIIQATSDSNSIITTQIKPVTINYYLLYQRAKKVPQDTIAKDIYSFLYTFHLISQLLTFYYICFLYFFPELIQERVADMIHPYVNLNTCVYLLKIRNSLT